METTLNAAQDLLFRFRTLTPVVQTSEKDANDKAKLRTMRTFFDDSETPGEIPILSGNSFRGRMRRILAYATWQSLDIDIQEVYANGTGALKETFHILTSGGTLGSGEKPMDRSIVAAVQNLLPILTLFGGSYAGSMHHGKIAVMNAKPATLDLRSTFPRHVPEEWFENRASGSTFTRGRETKGTGGDFTIYRHPDRHIVELPEVEAKAEPKEGEKSAANAYRNMPVSYDYILPGTTMIWQVVAGNDLTPLEWSMLGFAIQKVVAFPFLGGKLQAGNGHVEWLDVPEDPRLSAEPFQDYLSSRRDELRALLTHPKGLFRGLLTSGEE